MPDHGRTLARRIDSLKIRIETLSSLRKTVDLPREHDIAGRQWTSIESGLQTVAARLLRRLNTEARTYLPQTKSRSAAQRMNVVLGTLELQLSAAFTFFDTYMDILTQRFTPQLGPLLAGCDVLAYDALYRDHPALKIVEPPLVYCDRGFGASTLREGVRMPGQASNPLPLVQIPYARLKEKPNLTSILHEVGHETMVRLGLVKTLPQMFRRVLENKGAPATISELFALWSSEIGPDFWTFCASGIAEAGAIREILALPPSHCFRVSWTDPHPPPYLRVLLSFEWCRQVWGAGIYDEWEREWLDLYPIEQAPVEQREIIKKARQYLPLISRVLLQTRFPALYGKAIPTLFKLSALAPSELRRIVRTADSGALNLRGLPPCGHLAVFRLLREQGKISEERIDAIMTQWLVKLGKQKKTLH
jgi:hypothetical protein